MVGAWWLHGGLLDNPNNICPFPSNIGRNLGPNLPLSACLNDDVTPGMTMESRRNSCAYDRLTCDCEKPHVATRVAIWLSGFYNDFKVDLFRS